MMSRESTGTQGNDDGYRHARTKTSTGPASTNASRARRARTRAGEDIPARTSASEAREPRRAQLGLGQQAQTLTGLVSANRAGGARTRVGEDSQ